MDANATAITQNLISAVIFAVIVRLARWVVERLFGSDPRKRKTSLGVVVTIWMLGNILYYILNWPLDILFLLSTSLIVGWICYRELNQFWQVDLVGVDAEIRCGLDSAKALRMCTTSLDFLGIGASKLTGEKLFAEAVNRCEGPGRPIRLLLSKPMLMTFKK